MQTFLPYPSFEESAAHLDNKRLGKQRVEALQILRALQRGPGAGWYNHPAVQMWKGHELALMLYHDAVIDEWKRRGFRNYMASLTKQQKEKATMPPWLGDERFHASHRSNLLRKLPKHYSAFGWKETDDLPYYWPTKKGD